MKGEPFLNRRLVLESRALSPDGAGGFLVSWEEVGVLWGAINLRPGREARLGGRERTEVGGHIVIRAAQTGSPQRPGADQRLRAGTRVFGILSVSEWDQAGRFLICQVREERP